MQHDDRRQRARDAPHGPMMDAPDRADVGAGTGHRRRRHGLLRLHPPAARSAWMLPAQPSRLIGRAGELAAARALLLRDDVRLLTLTGPPGWARPGSPSRLPSTWARASPTASASSTSPRSGMPARSFRRSPVGSGHHRRPAVRRFRRSRTSWGLGRRCWCSTISSTCWMRPRVWPEILAACSRCRGVVTSRAPLHLRWEHVLAVPPLAAA